MKKFLRVFLVGLLCLACCSCYFVNSNNKKQDDVNNKYTEEISNIEDGFFIWMNAYVALPINNDFVLALSYYYLKDSDHYVHKDDISMISLNNVSGLEIVGYEVQELNVDSNKYNGYCIYVTIHPTEKGIWYTDTVEMQLIDGKIYKFPFGDWYIDVDSEDSGRVDTYSSTVFTTSSSKFKYNYVYEDQYILKEIQYWNDLTVDEDVKQSDVLTIDSEAPFNYIKSKGLIEYEGVDYRFYGVGCYLGTVDADNDDLDLSYNHNKVN